jgi:hypothetical protein
MLDTKKIIQLGIGVAIGMLAYFFISKAMNKNGETVDLDDAGAESANKAGFLGTTNAGSCRFNSGGVSIAIPCGGTVSGGHWNGYSANCSGSGLGGCQIVSPSGVVVATGDRVFPVTRSRR